MRRVSFCFAVYSTLALSICSLPSMASEEAPVDIHSLCQSSPVACIEHLPEELAKQKEGSRSWYALKIYQFDALHILERSDELKAAISPFLAMPNLPVMFSAHLYTHYAKLLSVEGDKKMTDKYLNKAINLLDENHKHFLSPMLQVQIANLELYQARYRQAFDRLQAVEVDHGEGGTALFQYELYNNLGHAASFLKDVDGHLKYRLKAMEWVTLLQNQQKLSEGVYNLARAYQGLEQHENALTYFSEAYQLATQAGDEVSAQMALLRLAEVSLACGQKERGKAYLQQLDESKLPETARDLWTELSGLLGATGKRKDEEGRIIAAVN
ncbi:tetratricopeptide repeat protein [Aliiglaciecola sp. CAU 1673]|uniref:tetratricopeptide repeat protein n=1 Tax=Aliiglaciecola sp. CAU 1673 TaxID=3032595 RepID=UPI0023DC62B6|nr:tetratricopeptide repeat protein [Aliiglaciecola sp. CAU 1673]MDF2179468.1 tetratricopeptide repeat protein [Aliiglaciecola sp. CAU 1673]